MAFFQYIKQRRERKHYFYFSLFILLFSFFTGAAWQIYATYAAAEELTCTDGEIRVISVGTFTDASGDEFNEDSDLTLSADVAANCTFVLTQSETDEAVSLASLTIDSGVTLTHATSTAVANTYNRIELNVTGNVTVDGSIDVSGKGYLGGREGGNASDEGRGYENKVGGSGSDINQGGSHGGRGGADSGDVLPPGPYDSITQPYSPGAGGGAGSSDPGDEGGNGGGVVILSAANFSGTGSILANGGASDYGGGAGGAITLDSNGGDLNLSLVTANGGDSANQGAGGGGRISFRNYENFGVEVHAIGGLNGLAEPQGGAAGTIYSLSNAETYGTLMVNNGGFGDVSAPTEISSLIDDADAVEEYGGALVFDSVLVSEYGLLHISAGLDSVSDGSVDFYRSFYVSSCPVDNDNLVNGELIYDHLAIADAETADYICVAPQRVISLDASTGLGIENDTSVEFAVTIQGPTTEEVLVEVVVQEAETTATPNGGDFTTSSLLIVIPIGATTGSYSFDVTNDDVAEDSEEILFALENPEEAVVGTENTFTYTIIDNDAFTVVPTETDGGTVVYEDDSTDTFTVQLDAAPTVNVDVIFAITGQATLSTSSVQFTPDDWNIERTVTVTASEDAESEEYFMGDISYTVSSTDIGYNAIDERFFWFYVEDNDQITVTESAGTTVLAEEGVTTDTIEYVLEFAPDSLVTINVTSDDDTVTLSTSTVYFHADDYDEPKTVTFTVADDDVDNDRDAFITYTVDSEDANFDNAQMATTTISITDTDGDGPAPGLVFTGEIEGTWLYEPSVTATYTVELATLPMSDVTVTLSLDGSVENIATLSTYSLVFTVDDWDVPQTVIISSDDDGIANDSTTHVVTHTVSSEDDDYNSLDPEFHNFNIVDDDQITVTESDDSTELAEEGVTTDTIDYVLEYAPTEEVTINLTSSDDTVTLSTTTVYFNADDFGEVKTVTFTVADDDVDNDRDAYITYTVESDDLNFGGAQMATSSISITDTDTEDEEEEAPAPRRGGGGGGGVIRPTVDASGNALYSIKIENAVEKTSKTKVNLSFVGNDIQSVAVSNFENFAGVSYVPYVGNILFDLLPGPGIKTVYAKVQTRNGIVYNISDSIELIAALPPVAQRPNIPVASTANCTLIGQKPYKTSDSPRVYIIHKYIDGATGDRCTKEYLGSPLHFFSYFSSWGDVQVVSAEVLNGIPDDAFASPVLGPRFIPYNGSIVKTVDSDQAYYIINGSKHLLTGEAAFRHMGFDTKWVQTVNTEIFNGFKDGGDLTPTSAWPLGLVIRFSNIPSRAYQVLETTTDNKVRVKDLGLIEKMDDKIYRRDRVVTLEKNINVLLPGTNNVPKVTITRFLKLGSVGSDVRYLQAKLQSLGYFTYESATGRYGYETVRAVERFQKDHGIEVKGYVGPATRNLINSL